MPSSQCLASWRLGAQNHEVNSTTAFKEWLQVCEALGSGQQSVILRKGGIHEGRSGFSFEHDQFILFPTLFHEQGEHLKAYPGGGNPGQAPEYQPGDGVNIRYWAKLSSVWNLGAWETIKELEPFHIWKRETIRERFGWSKSPADSPGINMALVRIYRLEQPWRIEYQNKHGGCRSWLKLPLIARAAWKESSPALNDKDFLEARQRIHRIAGVPDQEFETEGGD